MPGDHDKQGQITWQMHARHALELLRKARMIHDLERQNILASTEALTITGALIKEAVDEMDHVLRIAD